MVSLRILQQWQTLLVPWLSVTLLVALILIPLGLFFWMALGTDLFVVEAVTVLDGRDSTIAAVEEIVEQELNLVPMNRSIFFVQADSIESKISQALPQVRIAHIERKLPDTLKIVLQEKTPVLLLLSNGTYYLVDDLGIPYEEARLHTLPGVVLPTVKNADAYARVTLGVPAVAKEFVAFVQYMGEHLGEAVPAKIAEIRIPSLAAREVHFVLDTNWVVKFDVTRDPARQLGILTRIATEMLSADEQKSLEYIDLRIPNRVYYKTK